jgi:hypothetical protein
MELMKILSTANCQLAGNRDNKEKMAFRVSVNSVMENALKMVPQN